MQRILLSGALILVLSSTGWGYDQRLAPWAGYRGNTNNNNNNSNSDTQSDPQAREATRLNYQANELYNAGNYTDALPLYRQAYNLHNTWTITNNLNACRSSIENEKGVTYFHNSDFANAIAEFQYAITLMPVDRTDAVTSLNNNLRNAQSALAQQQADAARKAEIAAQHAVNFERVKGLWDQGRERYHANDMDSAERFFRQALQVEPNNSEWNDFSRRFLKAINGYKNAHLGDKAYNNGNIADAKSLYEKALESSDNDTMTNTLAVYLKDKIKNCEIALSANDAAVVDARDVPTGLPDTIAAQIPDTPAGSRVRKGFQAMTAEPHDWNAAHAWFLDALNHDPGNAGLKRLVELSDYMTKAGPDKADHPPIQAFNDFNKDRKKPLAPKSGWQPFFDAVFGGAIDDKNE